MSRHARAARYPLFQRGRTRRSRPETRRPEIAGRLTRQTPQWTTNGNRPQSGVMTVM